MGPAVASRRGVTGLLAICALLWIASSGCRSSRGDDGADDVAVLQPSVLPTPEPQPPTVEPIAATPTPALTESTLARADRAFEAGDYAAARDGYETHLAGLDAAVDADRALYRLAVLAL